MTQIIGTDNPQVQEAFERIIALRELTATTGTKTYKSQSAILESLEPAVLAAVAVLLKQHGNGNGNGNGNRNGHGHGHDTRNRR
jgi:hypothetical protein